MNADKRRSGGRFSSLRLSAFICGFIIFLSGCGPKKGVPEPYRGPTDSMENVVRAINQNNRKLPTLWTSISRMRIKLIDDNKKEHNESLDGSLLYRAPQDVRITGHNIAGNLLEIGSNKELYWLIARSPGPDTTWWGRYKYLGADCSKPIPVRPDMLVQVLGVSTINDDFTQLPAPVMRFNNDSDCYMFIWSNRLPDRWWAMKEVWYDRQTKLPTHVFLFDVNGRIVLSARLGNHKPVEVPNVPKEQWPKVAFDYNIQFPDTGSSLHLVLGQVQLNRKGQPSDATFRFDPSIKSTSTMIQLDEDCGD